MRVPLRPHREVELQQVATRIPTMIGGVAKLLQTSSVDVVLVSRSTLATTCFGAAVARITLAMMIVRHPGRLPHTRGASVTR